MLLDIEASMNILRSYIEIPELDTSNKTKLSSINGKSFLTGGFFKKKSQ